MITLIAAMDKKRAIGKNGDLPWRIKEDLALFQRETQGGALIMGRRTWESLPRKLEGRLNVVVTRAPLEGPDVVAQTLDDAVAACQNWPRIYAIGGARIYEGLMTRADRLVLTFVQTDVEGADTYFPEWDDSSWHATTVLPLQSSPQATAIEYLRHRA